MPKLPEKKTRLLAKWNRQGVLEAENEFFAKTLKNKKQLKNWLGQKFSVMIDKIDPLKLMAVLSATFFIKSGIEWSEELISIPVDTDIFRMFMRLGYGVLGLLIPKSPEAIQKTEEFKQFLDTPQVEILEWGLSFLCAYLLVEHADALLAIGGDLIGSAKGLLGVLAVV